MKNILFSTVLFLSIVNQLFSQHANILVSNSNAPNEPSIIINPQNPMQMIAGANLDNVYYSNDGGFTWSEDQLSSSLGVWGDPTITVDTAGNFYFLHLSNPASGNWIDRIVCQKMDGFSQTWSDGSYMGLNGTKAQDKQWPIVDPLTNNLYVTWTQFDSYGSNNPLDSSIILFSKSTDAGMTWSNAIRINKQAGDCIDSDNTTEGAVPAVGPNGEIYVAWSGPAGIMFDKSMDQGNTWLEEDIFVSDIPGGWDYSVPAIYRCNGLPVTCCDLSNGPHRGTIYINWTDQRNGVDDTDVWLSKSTDGGDTWSSPIRVNNDSTKKHQFFTWLAVDQATGKLWFVWYDRRNFEDERTDVYMAVSEDGGNSFTNFKISESPFLPSASIFFGDYTNVSAYNDTIRPIWGRCDNTDQSIYTAIIDPLSIGNEDESMLSFEISNIYPNPGIDDFAFSYKLHRSAIVRIELLNALGKEIAIIRNEREEPGRHLCTIDATALRLNTGVYFVITSCGEFSLTQRFVVCH